MKIIKTCRIAFWVAFILSITYSCKSSKQITVASPSTEVQEEMIERELDPIEVSGAEFVMDTTPKIYKPSATLSYDIIHTALDLKFDYAKQHVLGKANLQIKPYFKSIEEITLDADGFEIKEVKLNNTIAKHTYDGSNLKIQLGKSFSKDEKFEVYIDYIAKPEENNVSGSAAITSDKGLFFIDPLENDPELPTQIWTQGETEHNSRWYPTFDQPNERFTQEIKLTVPEKYLTLSNGLRISSAKNADGTRTDVWKQDKPHAPYLTMIAVGEWHEEKDTWNGKPLHFFVEKGWANYAKKIYNNTPEMLTFFSTKLNYPYPWDKYAQIAVKEYVSGAMENTSAVIFGDFVQKTDREMIDNDNDQIVAHEMMHHWFGDLVTCEDWSNLTLNEGFANYAEYLWYEYKYGKERAEYHRFNEMNGYLSSIENGGAHSLIHYYYNKDEDMFDAHSYNKGGLVLHMLRNYLGDEAFFAGLNKYLNDNKYTAVEVDELRMAFEDTTGEDLQWFFDQWFHGVGQPMVKANYTYDDVTKTLTIDIDQSETDSTFHRPFILPLDVALYYSDGTMEYRPIRISEMKQSIKLENIKSSPSTFALDGRNIALALFKETRTKEQGKELILRSDKIFDQIYGLTSLLADGDQSTLNDGVILNKMMKDKAHFSRMVGIQLVNDEVIKNQLIVSKLEDLALRDPHSEVRNSALQRLAAVEDFDAASLSTLILQSEQAYPVISTALQLSAGNEEKAKKYFDRFKNEPTDVLAPALASLITGETDEELTYLESKARSISLSNMYEYFGVYQVFLNGKSNKTLERSFKVMDEIVSGKGNMYRRMSAFNILKVIAADLAAKGGTDNEADKLVQTVKNRIAILKDKEINPTVKAFMDAEQEE